MMQDCENCKGHFVTASQREQDGRTIVTLRVCEFCFKKGMSIALTLPPEVERLVNEYNETLLKQAESSDQL